MSGYLLQSLLIQNHGFVPRTLTTPPQVSDALRMIGLLYGPRLERSIAARVIAHWTLATFDRFTLETPDENARSPDLNHVRVWRAFGACLPEGEAMKILVCGSEGLGVCGSVGLGVWGSPV